MGFQFRLILLVGLLCHIASGQTVPENTDLGLGRFNSRSTQQVMGLALFHQWYFSGLGLQALVASISGFRLQIWCRQGQGSLEAIKPAKLATFCGFGGFTVFNIRVLEVNSGQGKVSLVPVNCRLTCQSPA